MTLAQAWDLPMAAVSSLSCYTYAFSDERALICPMIDARHGQVFCGAFLSADAQNGEGFLPKTVEKRKSFGTERNLQSRSSVPEKRKSAVMRNSSGLFSAAMLQEKYASPAVKLRGIRFTRGIVRPPGKNRRQRTEGAAMRSGRASKRK